MLHCDLVNFNFTLTVVRRRVFFFPTQVSSPIFWCSFHPNRKILLPFFVYGYLDTVNRHLFNSVAAEVH